MRRIGGFILLFLVLLLVRGSALWAQDGRTLYTTKFCITCHGPRGFSADPYYPNLAKQDRLYLFNQVNDILAKRRANKFTLLMTEHPVVAKIKEDEISAIAEYLSRVKRSPGK